MKFQTQNLTDNKYPLWRAGRAWWKKLYLEWYLCKEYGFGFSFGLRRWGFNISLGKLLILYFSIGERNDTELSISFFEGSLVINHPWERKYEWRSSDPWWKKSIRFPVKDWLLGRRKVNRSEGDPEAVYIPMPEGCYIAKATPVKLTFTRRWYIPKETKEYVNINIEGGIPYRGKGENSWDCGDDGLWGTGGDTVEGAIGNVVATVLKNRKKYGYDSKSTGKYPYRIVN